MNDNTIIFGVLAIGILAAVIIFRQSSNVDDVLDIGESEDIATATGPSYLVYNNPWGFAAPIQPVLPNPTAGQIGQVKQDCGCF